MVSCISFQHGKTADLSTAAPFGISLNYKRKLNHKVNNYMAQEQYTLTLVKTAKEF